MRPRRERLFVVGDADEPPAVPAYGIDQIEGTIAMPVRKQTAEISITVGSFREQDGSVMLGKERVRWGKSLSWQARGGRVK